MSQKKARQHRQDLRAQGIDTDPEPKRPTRKYASKREIQAENTRHKRIHDKALAAIAAAAAGVVKK